MMSIELFNDPTKLYLLNSESEEVSENGIITGQSTDGLQVLIGNYNRKPLVLFFDLDGGIQGIQHPSQDHILGQLVVSERQDSLEWRPGLIRVRGFMLPEHRIYLADYPTWGIVFRQDPFVYPTAEDREAVRRQMEDWDARGMFVLWFGDQEYHFGQDGAILGP